MGADLFRGFVQYRRGKALPRLGEHSDEPVCFGVIHRGDVLLHFPFDREDRSKHVKGRKTLRKVHRFNKITKSKSVGADHKSECVWARGLNQSVRNCQGMFLTVEEISCPDPAKSEALSIR